MPQWHASTSTSSRTNGAAFWSVALLSAFLPERTTPSAPPASQITTADLQFSDVGHPPAIDPRLLEPLRIAGSKIVEPNDDAMKTGHRIKGSFKYCLDVTGHMTSVTLLQTTSVPSYDNKIASEMAHWAFRPVVVDGKPTAVCSAATFIFSD
jgi:hypothetical protein